MPVPPVIQMYRYVMGSGGGLGNLLKASEEFQQTRDWVRYPSDSQTPTVNDDSRPDPNGGGTADQVGFTANTSARLQQTVTLSASTQYTFSVYARAVSGTVDFRMRNVTLKETEVKTATTTGPDGGGFTRFTYTFTTGAAGSYELALQNAAGTPTARDVIFWGAMLNQGGTALDYQYAAPTTGGSAPAPAYAGFGDSFGGVTAYYSLRQFTEAETLNAIRVRRSSDDTEQDIGFDANGDLDTTTLLDFVGGQNLLVQSNQFDISWTISEGTILGGQTGYDGSTNAWLYTDNVGTTLKSHDVRQSVSASGVNCFSIYAKMGTRAWVKMYNGLNTCFFNIDPNYVGNRVGTDDTLGGSIEDVGNGWFRLSVFDNGSASLVLFGIAGGDGSGNYISDGTGTIYIQDAQLEEASTATTYNPTTTGIGGDGAVTTFYDQSGNGNNATNSTASEQPLVVSGGTLVTENSKAAIKPIDRSTTLQMSALTLTANTSVFSVLKNNSLNSTTSLIEGDNANEFLFIGSPTSTSTLIDSDYTSVSRFKNGLSFSPSTRQDVYNGVVNQTLITHFFDGSVSTSVNLGYPSSAFIGMYLIQELIIFDSDQTTNRTGIETNINDHFSIYP